MNRTLKLIFTVLICIVFVGCARISGDSDIKNGEFSEVYRALHNTKKISVISVAEARGSGESDPDGYGVNAYWNGSEKPIEFVALFFRKEKDSELWAIDSIGFVDFDSVETSDKYALKQFLENMLKKIEEKTQGVMP